VPSPDQLKCKGTITKRGGTKLDKNVADQNKFSCGSPNCTNLEIFFKAVSVCNIAGAAEANEGLGADPPKLGNLYNLFFQK